MAGIELSTAALAAELKRLGIAFVESSQADRVYPPPSPPNLLAALATAPEARLRMALIPLFLARPEFVLPVTEVVDDLPEHARVTLMCYYTAAVLLQRKYVLRLAQLGINNDVLPHLFDTELDLPSSSDVDLLLAQLAKQHEQLSERPLNWQGTYEQAATRFFRRVQQEQTWAVN